MSIIDLSSFTSKLGTTTAVWLYDEAETFVLQHDFLHLSFFKDDFRDFVDTLQAALREIDKREGPMAHIYRIIVRENGLAAVESEE